MNLHPFTNRRLILRLAYPAILLVGTIAVLSIFAVAAGYIAQKLDGIFAAPQSDEAFTLDLPRYALVAQKLGISDEGPTQAEPIAPEEAAAPEPDPLGISIVVQNATETEGLAGTLRGRLVVLGFASTTVGNAPELQEASVAMLSPTHAKYAATLQKILGQNYKVEVSIDPEAPDCIITIGANNAE